MTDSDSTIDWSYSNAQLFASCPRSLFFHHWQAAGNAEVPNEGGDDVFRGGAESTGAIIGSAIHKALEEHIRCWAQNERTGMKQTQSVAKSYIRGVASQRQGSQSFDISDLSETTDKHLKQFFKTVWPSIRSERYIIHEETRSFEINGATVWVRPDLCVRESADDRKDLDRFVIYDWKSRRSTAFENSSLQLYVYALWAHKEFEPDIERISARLVFTGSGQIKRQKVSIPGLQSLEARISKEVAEWNPPTQKSSFPTDSASTKCTECPYLSSCVDGQRETKSL